MSSSTGSCQCGAIQYRYAQNHSVRPGSVDAENDRYPAEAEVFSMVSVPADSFRIRGLAPSVFEYRALDGDIALRSFCPQCGTTLFAEFESDPDMVYVRAMSLAIDTQFDTAEALRFRRPQSGARHGPVSNVLRLPQFNVS